jgi:hypothetical protein
MRKSGTEQLIVVFLTTATELSAKQSLIGAVLTSPLRGAIA